VRSPLKAQLQAELAAAANDEERDQITNAFSAREKALEHDLDHKSMDLHMTLDLRSQRDSNLRAAARRTLSALLLTASLSNPVHSYNFLSK